MIGDMNLLYTRIVMGTKAKFIVVLHNRPRASQSDDDASFVNPVEILYVQALHAQFDSTNFAYTGVRAAKLSAAVTGRVVARCLREISTLVSATAERV